MSSRYAVLCLLHPAATETGVEYTNAADLEAALANRANHPDLKLHDGCDLIGGQFSYPLIKVYCPPSHPEHARGKWTDSTWLALLLAAHDSTTASPRLAPLAAAASRYCWPAERLERLRGHLIPEAAA